MINISFDSLSPSVSIDHHSCWWIYILFRCFYWLANTGVSKRSSPWENDANEFIPSSPAVPSISCSAYLDGLLVAIQLLFCWVLLLGFVQNSSQHPCSFFSKVLVEPKWCSYAVVLTQLQFGRISILFYQRAHVLSMRMLTLLSVDEIIKIIVIFRVWFALVSLYNGISVKVLLYIDLRPSQTCYSKDGGSAFSIGVGELGWQNGTR